MIKDYKKGQVVTIEYKMSNQTDIAKTTGVVFKVLPTMVTLVHNFSGTDKHPLDITKISRKNILMSKEITPKEINTPEDLLLKEKVDK